MNFKKHLQELLIGFLEKLLKTRELSETELKIINVISNIFLFIGFVLFGFVFLGSLYSLFFEPFVFKIDNLILSLSFLFLESVGLVVNILILKRTINKENEEMSTLRLKKHLCFLGMTSASAMLCLSKYMGIFSVITIWIVLIFSVFALITIYKHENDCDKI